MEKLKFNPSNKQYYSEEFIKGFECGVERQFNADMAEKTAEWIIHPVYAHLVCRNCLSNAPYDCKTNYCPNCGAKMKGVEE